MTMSKESHDTAEWEDFTLTLPEEETNIFDLIRNTMNFASLLRVCGAMIMLVAMSSYLLQGWSEGNDISRYYMLLSQTLLLAISGFGLSCFLKENKGARIFFGLGLVSITVNMTTLGALIFSTTQWGSEVAHIPGYAKWIAPDFGAIMMALLGTLAISAPVVWAGHKVLARRSAHLLSVLFLFTNLLLLLPVRESIFVGGVVLAAVTLPLVLLYKQMSQDNTLRTPEGLFAMATIFVPAGIMICRSIWFYPVDEILQIILAGTAFIAIRFTAQQTEETSFAREITHWLSLGTALGVSIPSAMLVDRFLADQLAYNVFGIIFALLLLDISTRCEKPLAPVRLATIVLAGSHVLTVMFMDELSGAIMCILAGLLIIAVGRQHGLRNIMLMGVLTFLAGVGRPVLGLAEWIDFSNWITLSVSGGVIIVAASLIERHGALIKLKWDRLMQSMDK